MLRILIRRLPSPAMAPASELHALLPCWGQYLVHMYCVAGLLQSRHLQSRSNFFACCGPRVRHRSEL